MSELTEHGGKWLAAVRRYVQNYFVNGDCVLWGSNEVLHPSMTIRQVEEIAAIAVDVAEELFYLTD